MLQVRHEVRADVDSGVRGKMMRLLTEKDPEFQSWSSWVNGELRRIQSRFGITEERLCEIGRPFLDEHKGVPIFEFMALLEQHVESVINGH